MKKNRVLLERGQKGLMEEVGVTQRLAPGEGAWDRATWVGVTAGTKP